MAEPWNTATTASIAGRPQGPSAAPSVSPSSPQWVRPQRRWACCSWRSGWARSGRRSVPPRRSPSEAASSARSLRPMRRPPLAGGSAGSSLHSNDAARDRGVPGLPRAAGAAGAASGTAAVPAGPAASPGDVASEHQSPRDQRPHPDGRRQRQHHQPDLSGRCAVHRSFGMGPVGAALGPWGLPAMLAVVAVFQGSAMPVAQMATRPVRDTSRPVINDPTPTVAVRGSIISPISPAGPGRGGARSLGSAGDAGGRGGVPGLGHAGGSDHDPQGPSAAPTGPIPNATSSKPNAAAV
jgi:hypothetical protein